MKQPVRAHPSRSYFGFHRVGRRRDSCHVAAANSLRREAESQLLEMKEALELQVTVSDNLRLAVGLVLDDLGIEAATALG